MAPVITDLPAGDAAAYDAVRALLRNAEAADGVEPISEAARLDLRAAAVADNGPREVRHLVVMGPGGSIDGYARLDLRAAATGAAVSEFAIAPTARNQGNGASLLDAQLRISGRYGAALRAWAHGDLPAAAALARRVDLSRDRVLWQIARPLGGSDGLPERALPPGITLRTFVVGADESAWLAVNNRAFADHPEQGRWTVNDVLARESEPWFDPAGFLLAVRPDGSIAGFHWTKVRGGTPGGAAAPIGEVYVLGVDPSAQGLRLGPALTVAGLKYLQQRGIERVILYVDDSNPAARATYRKLGFADVRADVQYVQKVSSGR